MAIEPSFTLRLSYFYAYFLFGLANPHRNRHWPIVLQMHLHIRAKRACLYGVVRCFGLFYKIIVQLPRQCRWSSLRKAWARAFAGVCRQGELAYHQ